MTASRAVLLLLAAFSFTAPAQTVTSVQTAAPAPAYSGTPGDYVAHDFRFGTGETLPELKLHYLTLGHRITTPQVASIMPCSCSTVPEATPAACSFQSSQESSSVPASRSTSRSSS